MAAAAGIVVATALLAWSAGVLVYQRKVARAVENLREEHLRSTEPGSYPAGGSVAGVLALGCRALPALMAELELDATPYYLCRVNDCLVDLGDSPRVVFDEDREGRRRSIDALRAWWERGGRRRHDWWRFWTSKCVE